MNRYLLMSIRGSILILSCVFCGTYSGGPALAAVAFRPLGGASLLRPVDNPASRLESLIVEVNGERRRVEPATGITVVRGDLLTIVEAWLVDKSKLAPVVDVAGFSSRLKRSGQDDRGKVIDTSRDFDPRQSEDGKGGQYAIRVIGSGVLYGATLITIEEPELISFEVEVNGQRRKLAPGDKLSLSARDGIRVIDIRTNVRGNENVRHDLAKKRNPDGSTAREIRFTRGESVFARIPIDWQGS